MNVVDVTRQLAALPRPLLIAAVGNRLKADDGAGPAVADALRAAGVPATTVLDCGVSPENFTRELTRQSKGTILFCDAAHLNEAAGTVRLIPCSDIASGGVFTHGASLDMIARYISMHTCAELWLLAIQPLDLTLSAPLSEPVRQAVSQAVQALVSIVKEPLNA